MGKITDYSTSLNQRKACLNQSNSAQKNSEVRYLNGKLNLENYLKRHWLQDLEKQTGTDVTKQ